jgi:hypothetical protein
MIGTGEETIPKPFWGTENMDERAMERSRAEHT